MTGEDKHSYCFNAFELKPLERQLLHGGQPVALTPKAFEILTLLVANAGHLVKKEEIIETIWADAFVEEANLARLIHTLRKTLGEDGDGNKFIETVAKQGYRFVADVTRQTELRSKVPLTPTVDAKLWSDEPSESGASVRKPLKEILFVALAASVLAALLIVLELTQNPSPAAVSKRALTIAILPFRPINAAERDLPYDLAFANSLIAGLNGSKDLVVRPFSTMRVYTDVSQDPIAIGKERMVDYVLESNYLALDGRLQVTSNLFNVNTGVVEASFKYDGDLNLQAASQRVAAKVGPELLAKLNLQAVLPDNRGTISDEAWPSYLQGMILANKRSVEDAEKAILEFENAVRLDPQSAEGYVGLAHALQTVWINGGGDTDQLGDRISAAAKKALDLDPGNGEAYSLHAANEQHRNWDFAQAGHSFERAVELAPNSPMVRRYYAVNLMNLGKFDEALEHLKIARELDPNQTWNEKLLGRVLFFARRYDEAIAQSIKAKDLDPEVEQTSFVFMAYELKGDTEKAMGWFLVVESLKKGTTEADLNEWRNVYAADGWPGVLVRRLELAELSEKHAQTPEAKANCYADIASLAIQLGDFDKAFPYLEKAILKYPLFAAQLKVNPYLDPIRSDPRYPELLARSWNKAGQ